MPDNGIYSGAFDDGRHDLLNELADMLSESESHEDFGAAVESLLEAEGAV